MHVALTPYFQSKSWNCRIFQMALSGLDMFDVWPLHVTMPIIYTLI